MRTRRMVPAASARKAGNRPPKVAGLAHPGSHTSSGVAEAFADKDNSSSTMDEEITDQPGSNTRFSVFLARLRANARPKTVVPLVLAVGVLVALGYLVVQLREQEALDSARTEALSAARGYAKDLSTYNYNNLNGNFAAVTANSHGQFAQQYKQVSASLTELIKQNQAVSDGSVLSAGIVDADANHAVVALFVDQKITNTSNPQPRIDRNRMQMTLVHDNGRWLIDDIKLL